MKNAAQTDVNRSIRTARDKDHGAYVEHELWATDKDTEYESPNARKTQPGKFSTDLYHITSRDIASRNAGSILPLELGLLSPVVEEDQSQGQTRRFRKLNSFLGIEDDIPPWKSTECSQLNTPRRVSGDWELFDFESDEPKHQDTVSTAVLELEGSSISNISDTPEVCGDIPPILRSGRPLPVASVSNKPVSQAATIEKVAPSSLPKSSPNELFLPHHQHSEMLWSQPSRQRSNLRGFHPL